jgi:hypothetical protein
LSQRQKEPENEDEETRQTKQDPTLPVSPATFLMRISQEPKLIYDPGQNAWKRAQ